MIKLDEGRWLHDHDLESDIAGRSDSEEERRACIAYLNAATGATAESPGRAARALAELVAAKVRSSATHSTERPHELAETRAALAEANRVINRLLAFVPARSAEVSQGRLEEIAGSLLSEVNLAFPRSRQMAILIDREDDTETEACHRVTVRVQLEGTEDANRVAEGVERIHRKLVGVASSEERRAIRLIVEPEIAVDR